MSAQSSSSGATGFSFKNCFRNAGLEKLDIKAPEPNKTGTTISGVVFKDGVVLGADTRATADTLVVDSNCKKIHRLADNIYCCGAGTVADIQAVTRLMASNLDLFRLDSNRLPRVTCVTRMLRQLLFRHAGNMCAALIIGGVDATGPHISCVYPYGSSDVVPFATLGTGALAAMAVLETGFTEDMTLLAARKLVKESIRAGINNDLGSGSIVQLYVIEKDRFVEFKLAPETVYYERIRHQSYTFAPGTTAILEETVEDLKADVIDMRRIPIEDDDDQDDDEDEEED